MDDHRVILALFVALELAILAAPAATSANDARPRRAAVNVDEVMDASVNQNVDAYDSPGAVHDLEDVMDPSAIYGVDDLDSPDAVHDLEEVMDPDAVYDADELDSPGAVKGVDEVTE